MASSTSEQFDWSSFQRFLAGSGDDFTERQVAGAPVTARSHSATDCRPPLLSSAGQSES